MIVAMVPMRVVQVPIYQVIRVISMRHGFMTAPRSMLVILRMAPTIMVRRACRRIARIHPQLVLLHPFAPHVMQMPIVHIINVAIVLNTRVPAALTVLVIVILVKCRCRHVQFSFLAKS
ncbi:MAG TPA: hypothetical protein VGY77_06205 [Gemmataceae bacterium]|nr:hypothetical protein [Gemmataceae bacterium]